MSVASALPPAADPSRPSPGTAWEALARALSDGTAASPSQASLERLLTAAAAAVGAKAAALFVIGPAGLPEYRASVGDVPHVLPEAAEQSTDVATLPLIVGGEALGLLVLTGAPPRSIGQIGEPLAVVVSLALHNAELRAAAATGDAVAAEIAAARDTQRSLLPKDIDPETDGPFPLYGLNRPARAVSGDFFDYFRLPDGTMPFALGDVSGKGVNAALLMAKTASLFRCLAKRCDDPAELLREVNRELRETVTGGMFVTMVAGVYTPRSGQVVFANAGHEPPLVRWPDRTYQSYPAAAPPLGILDTIAIEAVVADLAGGEFYVFSDGLTEGGYDGREQLGVDGLIQMVEVYADQPLPRRIQSLLADLDGDGWDVRDDLTMLAIDDAIAGTAR